jgi:hypothetical protein
MSRTVSIFFSRDVTGFSEPGKCPRCKRKVNVGGRGGTKAHKCPHGIWCNAKSIDCTSCIAPLLDAAKKTPRETAPRRFTAAERATLEPLIVAAARQAGAESAYETQRAECLVSDEARCRCAPFRDAFDAATAATNAAGKALARAIKKARGGK